MPSHKPHHKPVVLCIAGHDPTGGAGLQADIETSAALGCHAVTAISCQTVQDTHDVRQVKANPPALLAAQIEAICSDVSINCVKIGMLGNAELTAVVSAALTYMNIPVVLDPVLAAGGGKNLADTGLTQAIRGLLPQVTLITPNRTEARRLASTNDVNTAAQQLNTLGCPAVLVTGADEALGDQVLNQLFENNSAPIDFFWTRLKGQFHGSGCTLSTACAAYMARGASVAEAVRKAQKFTWNALQNAHQPGHGQSIPARLDT